MRVAPCLALAVALVGNGPASADPDPLARLRWISRVLVLSAPEAGDRRVVEQRAAVDAARQGFGERDIVVVEALGAGQDAVAIRRRLSLPAGAFRAVLLGKDGGARIVSPDAISSERLFSTIDAMPMRQQEMRRRR